MSEREALNVILIVVDSLRADMPWAGYRRKIAPNLTKLARRAVDFRRAYSISSVTPRSMGPMLVGKYPSEMPRTGGFFSIYQPENLFLSERLAAAGHVSAAVHAHAYFHAGGMRQGFDLYQVVPGVMHDDPEPKPSSEKVTRAAQRLIARAADRAGERRFFAYVHYMDPHAEYIVHEDGPDFGDGLRDLYDGEVHHTDKWIGVLLDWVQKQRWAGKTAIIVTGDHGEGFGEHGYYKHGYELWEALVRVPLLFVVPGAAARAIEVRRSHIDLAPTILELMGVRVEPPLRGTSLVPELYGAEPEERPVVIDLPRDNLQDRRRAVIDGGLKLIARGDDDAQRWHLYDLAADPKERKNLAETDPARLEQAKKRYFEITAGIPNQEVTGKVPLKNAPRGRRW